MKAAFIDQNRSSDSWLFTLRAGLGVTILIKILSEFKFLYLLYGNDGVIQQDIALPLRSNLNLNLGLIQSAFDNPVYELFFLQAFFVVYGCFAIMLITGLFTKAASIFCWIAHVLLFNNTTLILYGFDSFLLTLSFYTMIFPVSSVNSLDNIFFRKKKNIPEYSNKYLKFLQLHLCIVYLVAGISKLRGTSWIEGSAIWFAVTQPQFYNFGTEFIIKIMTVNGISKLFSWLVLVLEISYPLVVWVKKVNKFYFLLIIGMHLFIGIFLGLRLFSLIMIIFNLAAFGHLLFGKYYSFSFFRTKWLLLTTRKTPLIFTGK